MRLGLLQIPLLLILFAAPASAQENWRSQLEKIKTSQSQTEIALFFRKLQGELRSLSPETIQALQAAAPSLDLPRRLILLGVLEQVSSGLESLEALAGMAMPKEMWDGKPLRFESLGHYLQPLSPYFQPEASSTPLREALFEIVHVILSKIESGEDFRFGIDAYPILAQPHLPSNWRKSFFKLEFLPQFFGSGRDGEILGATILSDAENSNDLEILKEVQRRYPGSTVLKAKVDFVEATLDDPATDGYRQRLSESELMRRYWSSLEFRKTLKKYVRELAEWPDYGSRALYHDTLLKDVLENVSLYEILLNQGDTYHELLARYWGMDVRVAEENLRLRESLLRDAVLNQAVGREFVESAVETHAAAYDTLIQGLPEDLNGKNIRKRYESQKRNFLTAYSLYLSDSIPAGDGALLDPENTIAECIDLLLDQRPVRIEQSFRVGTFPPHAN